MAVYPGAERETRVPLTILENTVQGIFEAAGMRVEAAKSVAESLVDADLRGIHSHGVLRVPDYVKKLTDEGVDPRGKPRIVSDNGAALVIDGGNNLGQVAMRFAMESAISRAKDINLAFAAVGGSNHAGTMDYYVRMALAHDMIGIAGTNALPTMAPWEAGKKLSASILWASQSLAAMAGPSCLTLPLVQQRTVRSASTLRKVNRSQSAGLMTPTGSPQRMR